MGDYLYAWWVGEARRLCDGSPHIGDSLIICYAVRQVFSSVNDIHTSCVAFWGRRYSFTSKMNAIL